jgi:hypothetical protein
VDRRGRCPRCGVNVGCFWFFLQRRKPLTMPKKSLVDRCFVPLIVLCWLFKESRTLMYTCVLRRSLFRRRVRPVAGGAVVVRGACAASMVSPLLPSHRPQVTRAFHRPMSAAANTPAITTRVPTAKARLPPAARAEAAEEDQADAREGRSEGDRPKRLLRPKRRRQTLTTTTTTRCRP